jgi:hypothetical protein
MAPWTAVSITKHVERVLVDDASVCSRVAATRSHRAAGTRDIARSIRRRRGPEGASTGSTGAAGTSVFEGPVRERNGSAARRPSRRPPSPRTRRLGCSQRQSRSRSVRPRARARRARTNAARLPMRSRSPLPRPTDPTARPGTIGQPPRRTPRRSISRSGPSDAASRARSSSGRVVTLRTVFEARRAARDRGATRQQDRPGFCGKRSVASHAGERLSVWSSVSGGG